MKSTIHFEKMPQSYTFCLISECPRAQHCLRHLAICENQVKSPQILVVNPILFDGEGCKFYREDKLVKIAYGMKDSFHQVKADDIVMLRRALYNHFGRSNFFRYRDGSLPITPDLQQEFRAIFKRYGYEVTFDRMTEEPIW